MTLGPDQSPGEFVRGLTLAIGDWMEGPAPPPYTAAAHIAEGQRILSRLEERAKQPPDPNAPKRPVSEVVVRSPGEDGFTRIVTVQPAYDHTEIEPKGFYGRHGAEVHFALVGAKGAINFVLYTHWWHPRDTVGLTIVPTPAGIFAHSRTPIRRGLDEHTPPSSECCEFLQGPCWDYTLGLLCADPVYDRLRAEGDPGVWDALEKFYREYFEETE